MLKKQKPRQDLVALEEELRKQGFLWGVGRTVMGVGEAGSLGFKVSPEQPLAVPTTDRGWTGRGQPPFAHPAVGFLLDLRRWVGLRGSQAISLAQKQAGDHTTSLVVRVGKLRRSGS